MKSFKLIFLLLFFMFLPVNSFSENLNLYVSILPQKYFAEKIGGDKINLNVMVLPGHSPATYSPKPKQMKELSKTDIYYSIGVPFEKVWLKKLKRNFKNLKFIDSSYGILKRETDESIFNEDHHDHHHHDDDLQGHDHGFYDPHVWMSPMNAIKISRNILNGLIDKDKENSEYYLTNYKNLINEIGDLDTNLISITDGIKKKEIFVYHPSWGYFMDDYGLLQVPVESKGKEPTPKYLSELIKHAEKKNIKTLLVQPQFPSSSIEVMEKTLNLKVYKADPLAYEWKDNLLKIAQIISR